MTNNEEIKKALRTMTAPRTLKVNPEDYEVNGILYCGNCNTPKQIAFDIGDGETIKPLCLCRCMTEQREAEALQEAAKKRAQQIHDARKDCFSEPELQNWTFENDDRLNARVSKIAENYVANFEELRKRGKGLLLFGTVGTGKTYYAACIANALIDRGHTCMLTNFARVVNTLAGMYAGRQEYIDSLNNYDLLVLDDLAAERNTEYMNEIIHNVIDSRYRAGLPTIVTTNLTDKELQAPTDVHRQRTYSRLLEMTIPVRVDGTDRRKEKLKADYKDLNDLLGL